MWCKLQKQIVQYSQNKDQKRLNFFGPFLTHPTTTKVSINGTDHQQNCHFSDPTNPVPLLTLYRDGPYP